MTNNELYFVIKSCGQTSNLSSDLPLGSRKFISEFVY